LRGNTVVLYRCIKNDWVECVYVNFKYKTRQLSITLKSLFYSTMKRKINTLYVLNWIKRTMRIMPHHLPRPGSTWKKAMPTIIVRFDLPIHHYASMNLLQFDIIRMINYNNYNTSTIRYRKIYIIYIINRKLVKPYVKYMKHQMCIIFFHCVFVSLSKY